MRASEIASESGLPWASEFVMNDIVPEKTPWQTRVAEEKFTKGTRCPEERTVAWAGGLGIKLGVNIRIRQDGYRGLLHK
eukprot:3867090-Pleurochrysis_carterae.AAC.1